MEQAKEQAEQAKEQAEQANKQAQQAMRDAEEAKRDGQKKDAEIAQLHLMLAQSSREEHHSAPG